MHGLGKMIMEAAAKVMGSGDRQGSSTQSPKVDPERAKQPMVERMVRDADPEKRAKAAKSLTNAFGN